MLIIHQKCCAACGYPENTFYWDGSVYKVPCIRCDQSAVVAVLIACMCGCDPLQYVWEIGQEPLNTLFITNGYIPAEAGHLYANPKPHVKTHARATLGMTVCPGHADIRSCTYSLHLQLRCAPACSASVIALYKCQQGVEVPLQAMHSPFDHSHM